MNTLSLRNLMSTLFLLACTAAVALVLSSCAKEGSGGSADPVAGPAAPPAPPPPTPEELLRGAWLSTVSKPEPFGVCQATFLRVSEREAIVTTLNSRESDCSLIDVETSYSVKHVVGAANQAGFLPIEFQQNTVRVKPVSDLGASLLKIRKWCGTDKWVTGQEIDVTARVEKNDRNCARSLLKNHMFKIEGDNLSLTHKIEQDRRNNIPASEGRLLFMRKK